MKYILLILIASSVAHADIEKVSVYRKSDDKLVAEDEAEGMTFMKLRESTLKNRGFDIADTAYRFEVKNRQAAYNKKAAQRAESKSARNALKGSDCVHADPMVSNLCKVIRGR